MNFIYDIIYIIAAFIIISGFYIQGNKYLRSMVMTQALQSVLIAVISFILGFILNEYTFYILGALVLILRVILVTYFLLNKIPKRLGYLYESKISVTYMLLVDLAFIVISIFIVYSVSFIHIVSHIFPDSNIILFPLLLFFQGLFIIVSRKRTIAQVLGYIEEENSLILLGMFILPVPIIIESSVFLDVLILVVIFSIISLEKTEHKPMEELKG